MPTGRCLSLTTSLWGSWPRSAVPIWFLSGALYPLQGLPVALAALTRIDPLTYGVDGVRGTMIGVSHFGVALDVTVLLGVGVLFVVAGAWRFSKIEV